MGCLPPEPDSTKVVPLSRIDGGVGEGALPDGGFGYEQCDGFCQPDLADLQDCTAVDADGGPTAPTPGRAQAIQCHYVHSGVCH